MTKIGIIGSGMVATAIGERLIELGNDVFMGSRNADGPATRWAAEAGERAQGGTFAEAAHFGELIVNATPGAHTLDALRAAGEEALAGKVLLDVSNPIDTEAGSGSMTLTVSNTDSLAEQIQRTFPSARVVKGLNTMNCTVMVDPSLVPGDHVVFVSGEDSAAKRAVTELLRGFGWPDERIIDLGGIATARGTESYLQIWFAMWQALGHSRFNISICLAT